MYATMDETWQTEMAGRVRTFRLRNEEGLIRDRLTLTCDGIQVFTRVYTGGENVQLFRFEGDDLELRWVNEPFAQRFGAALLRRGEVLGSFGTADASTLSAKPVVVSDVEMSWSLTFESSHTVALLYRERGLGDSLRISVDGAVAHDATIRGKGSQTVTIEQRSIEVRWVHEAVNSFRDALTSIAIIHDGRVLAHIGALGGTGLTNTITKVGIASADELTLEPSAQEEAEVFAIDEFPVDNRAGGAEVAFSETVSRSASNEVTIVVSAEGGLDVGLDALHVLKATLSAKLGTSLGLVFGETVSRSHSINLRIPAGDYTVYRVTWKRTRRRGTFRAVVNGISNVMSYDAVFGLMFRVDAQPGADQ